jgi:membrane protein
LLRRQARTVIQVLRLTGLSAWHGVVEFYNSHDLTFASSIAYNALLSLFPLLFLGFAILGRVTADEESRVVVERFVLQAFPRQVDFVTAQIDALRSTSLTFGIAGSLLMVWAGYGVFGAVTSAVNHAWGVETPHGYFKHKVVSFLMMGAAGLVLLLALALFYSVRVVEASWLAGILERHGGLRLLVGFAARWATTVLLIVVVGLVYYFVPNASVRFRDVWVGAVVTGLLWHGALALFQWSVSDMRRLHLIHGSIAAVIVFLLWVYVSAIILLYGVEFTAAFARLRRYATPPV